jgi:hypothetical protein
MIKGQVVKQRDLIHRADVNYRDLPSLNVSMIKLFDSDPIKFYEQFKLGKKKKDEKSLALILGDLSDFYLLDCKGNEDEFDTRFDEKFSLLEENKTSSQAFTLADLLYDITIEDLDDEGKSKSDFASRFTKACKIAQDNKLYKGKGEDQILKDLYEKAWSYFEARVANVGKILVDIRTLEKGKKIAKGLQFDDFTKDVFEDTDDIEYIPKFPIEWVYTTADMKAIACKSEIDILKIDHHEKKIYLKDLKTTYDNEAFEYGYIKHGYYLQAAFYYYAVMHWASENEYAHYRIDPMEFIVGDTSINNRRPLRYPTTMDDLKKSLDGFTLRGVKYKGLLQLIEEISWAEDNDIWNVSKDAFDNNGIIPLNLKYD